MKKTPPQKDKCRVRCASNVTIGVPAYARTRELSELLRSIYDQSVLPAEITICEDMSPERETIRSIVQEWRRRFEENGCAVNYIENEENLGYDRNLRRVITRSNSSYVMLMGNDDVLLADCIE